MRLELDQNASTAVRLERSAVAGPSGATLSHFDEVLTNGISAAQAGQRAQARILLQYAVELDPKSEAGWLWLASISEYPEELLVFLDRVLALNPDNSRAIEWKMATRQLMAKTFVQRGIDAANEERNAEALSCFDTALSYDEQNQLAWFWKDSLTRQPSAELDASVAEEAAASFEEPFVEETISIPSLYDQAEAALATGDHALALRRVNQAIEEDFESEKAWSLRSHLVDDFEDKRYSLERVVSINPDNQTARAALETLLAMVETTAPNSQVEMEAETEVFTYSPFESIAEPIGDAAEPEPTPTQDLELPAEMLDHNPFTSDESYEMAGDVWSPEAEMADQTDEPGAGSFDETVYADADAYPTIVVPYDEDAEPIYYNAEHVENRPIEPPAVPYEEENNPFLSPASPFATRIEQIENVTEVSASSYLEETAPVQESQEPEVLETSTPSWQDETIDAMHANEPAADTWVVEDTYEEPIEEPGAAGAPTILVVDDSAVVRKLIAGKLEESGYNVISAGSGVEALAVMSNARPDLVLLDIAMPKMDGYQVCEKIRKNDLTRDVPVVMISGKGGYFEEDRGQKAGTSSFISKPFGPETLMKALDTYLPSSASH
jgi:CheY-like chemotaxis protein